MLSHHPESSHFLMGYVTILFLNKMFLKSSESLRKFSYSKFQNVSKIYNICLWDAKLLIIFPNFLRSCFRELEPHFGTLLYIRMLVLFLVLLLAVGCTEDDRDPPSVMKYFERERGNLVMIGEVDMRKNFPEYIFDNF